VGQFHYVIRKRIQLAPEKALFLFCSNTIPPNGKFKVYNTSSLTLKWLIVYNLTSLLVCFITLAALMSTVYEEQKDEDGFLYVQYSGESTFGSE